MLTVIDKAGTWSQATSDITVTMDTPEQVENRTGACCKAEADPFVTPPQRDPNTSSHDGRKNGRAVKPVPGATPTAGMASADHRDWHAHRIACRPPAGPLVPPEMMTLLRWLCALRRCWRPAVCVGFVAAMIAAFAACRLLPPARFTAQATLQVYARAPVLAFCTAETQNQAIDEYKRYQKTQIELLRSRLVLLKVLQKPEFKESRTILQAKDPVQWLKDNLDVSFQNESEVLRIALKGEHPGELAALVNAIRDEYMEEVVNVELQKRTGRYEMLKDINTRKLETLAGQRKLARSCAESLGTNNPQALVLKQEIAIENQAMLEKELIQVRSQKRRAEAELASRLHQLETVSESGSDQVAQSDIESALDNDPSVICLTQRVEAAERQLNQHSALLYETARNPGADPLLGQLMKEMKRSRTELYIHRALRPTIAKELHIQNEEKDLDSATNLRRQLSILQDLEKRIEGERQQLAIGAKAINTKSLDLQSIQDEIVQALAATTRMGNEIQALDVELLAPPRVMKIEDAEIPTTSDARSRRLMIGLASMGSFLASLLGVTFWELQARRVSGSTEIGDDLGIHLIGTLPVMPVQSSISGRWRSRAREAQKERQLAESTDQARTMLLSAARSQECPVFTITSAMRGEGKTTLSSHLAISLARSGRKTLLIDANLRHPSIHQLFDQPQTRGLCELLRGDAAIDQSIITSAVQDLDLIAVGEPDSRALRALSLGKIAPILDLLRRRYDCVVIDTAPVLPVADTLLIAPFTDGAILAVLTDVSRSHKISEAHKKLIALGATVLGAVFNGDRAHGYENYFRYGDLRDSVREPDDKAERPRPEALTA